MKKKDLKIWFNSKRDEFLEMYEKLGSKEIPDSFKYLSVILATCVLIEIRKDKKVDKNHKYYKQCEKGAMMIFVLNILLGRNDVEACDEMKRVFYMNYEKGLTLCKA